MYVCICMYIYIHTYTYTHINTKTWKYMHTYTNFSIYLKALGNFRHVFHCFIMIYLNIGFTYKQ